MKNRYITEKIFACFCIALLTSMTFAAADSLNIPKEKTWEELQKELQEQQASMMSDELNDVNSKENPFSFSSLFNLDILPNVAAQGSCCLVKTGGVDFCVEIAENQCEQGWYRTGSSCSSLGECERGVCIPESGYCTGNMRKIECTYGENGDFNSASSKDDVPDCVEACCNVGNRDCTLEEKKVCVNKGGTRDEGEKDIGRCVNRCGGDYGCCHKATGVWINDVVSNCAAAGDNFFGKEVYCSSIPAAHITNCTTVEEYRKPGLVNKSDCYCFDSTHHRENLIESCGDEQFCYQGTCKNTTCVDVNEVTWPAQLRSGESTCLNILPGHFNPDERSSYLQSYVLSCQSGAIIPDNSDDQNALRDKICVEGTNASSGLWQTHWLNNTWQECLKCGSDWTGGIADAFGYVPLVGPLLSSGLTGGGICSDGFYPGEDCSKKGAVLAEDLPYEITDSDNFDGKKHFVMCGRFSNSTNYDVYGGKASGRVGSYDADLWATIGSCNPLYPPGRGLSNTRSEEDTCKKCGGGGDTITNICTEEECEHMGDCQFKPGNIGQSIIAGAGISLGLCAGALGLCALLPFTCPASEALCYGLASSPPVATSWVVLLAIGLGTGITISALGGAGARIEDQQYPKIVVNGVEKKQLGTVIVQATSINRFWDSALSGLIGPAVSVLAVGGTPTSWHISINEFVKWMGLTPQQIGQRFVNNIVEKAMEEAAKKAAIEKLAEEAWETAYKQAIGIIELETGEVGISVLKMTPQQLEQVTKAAEAAEAAVTAKVQDAAFKEAVKAIEQVPALGEGSVSVAFDPATKQATVTLKDPTKFGKVGAQWTKYVSYILNVVAALISFWSAGRALNAGSCELESPYTRGAKDEVGTKEYLNETYGIDADLICDKCGLGEGQWWCTKERCSILGSDCFWAQKMDSASPNDGICYTKKSKDTTPPVISSMTVTLRKSDQSAVASPKTGTAVDFTTDFTEIKYPYATRYVDINVTTDENAYCRVVDAPGIKYANMLKNFDSPPESSYPTTHTIKNLDISTLSKTDSTYTLYVKCQDVVGNKAVGDENSIKFKLAPPPDSIPPEIQNIDPFTVIPYDATSINLKILAYDNNEVNECKYSFNSSNININIDPKPKTRCIVGRTQENACNYFTQNIPLADVKYRNLTVADSILATMGADALSILNDLKGTKIYDLYIYCKDTRGNMAYANLSLMKGTLFNMNITSIKDGEIIKVKRPIISVNTSRQTTCTYKLDSVGYNFTGETSILNNFHSVQHSEALEPKKYSLSVECRDIAGTINSKSITFEVRADNVAANIIRAYNLNGLLHIATDKPSVCNYDNTNCNFKFEAGTAMPTDMTTAHETVWRSDVVFYIRCRNEWNAETCFTIKPLEAGTI